MKLIDRYISRQFLVTFLFSAASFAALFVLINLVENLDDFIDHNISTGRIILFYLSGLPETFLMTTPLSVLLAALFVTGKLSMQSELPALKSAGVSLGRLLRPFLLVASMVTLVNLVNSCWIVPATYDWSRGFEKRYLKSRKQEGEGSVHIRESKNRILTIGRVGSDLQSGASISLEEFDGTHLTSRIDADSVRIDNKKRWVFYNVRHRYFENGAERFAGRKGIEIIPIALSKNTFRMLNADPDQMNVGQLYMFIRQQEKAGISGTEKAKVKFNTKIALPFASVIIVMIGVPLSTRKKRSGLALEASISLIVGFLYLGMLKALSSIGYNGLLPPVLAAWLPNLIFIGAGAALFRSANE
ncbi:MAG: LPS export ABC transporter permease LptG [Chlorobiaceae bacterium]|nr:LPS export ABC transporter permease LptG [Chlorobiaceae bacterium]NTV25617.1 LPS export ABC transporter permease LptG [Chlorobiaceae bacterium]